MDLGVVNYVCVDVVCVGSQASWRGVVQWVWLLTSQGCGTVILTDLLHLTFPPTQVAVELYKQLDRGLGFSIAGGKGSTPAYEDVDEVGFIWNNPCPIHVSRSSLACFCP